MITLREESPNLKIQMQNVAMNISFIYEISTNTDVLDDIGVGHA